MKEEAERLLKQATEFYLRKDFGRAIPLVERCVSLREQAFGPDHPEVADMLFAVGAMCRESGDLSKALLFLHRSLAIRQKVFGPDNPVVQVTVGSVALAYKAQGNYAKAIPWYEQILQSRQKTFGMESTNLVAVLNTLGELYSLQGNPSQASLAFEKSLSITEVNDGKDDLKLASVLDRLGNLYAERADYRAATRAHERSLDIRKKWLGSESHTVAGNLNNLAMVFKAEGKYDLALSMVQRAFAIKEKRFGPDSPEIATVLNNLANIYQAQGSYRQALALHERSLAITEKAFGRQHLEVAITLNNLADCSRQLGDFARALPLYQRSLATTEELVGPDHPQVAAILNNLASFYFDLGDYPEAIRLLKHSLTIKEKALGTESLDVGLAANDLGGLLIQLGSPSEAVPRFEQSIAIYMRLLGEEHPLLATALCNLGSVRRQLGQLDEASALLQQSLAMRRKFWGDEHAEVAISLKELAELHRDRGDLAEAEGLYQRCLVISEKLFPPHHPEVMNCLFNLAAVHQAQNDQEQSLLLFSRASLSQRVFLLGQLGGLPQDQALGILGWMLQPVAMLHSACGDGGHADRGLASLVGAEQLSFGKALLEEAEVVRSALETDPQTTTRELRDQYQAASVQLTCLSQNTSSSKAREARRRQLQSELSNLEKLMADRVVLVARSIQDRTLSLADVAKQMEADSALLDVVHYQRFDFAVRTKEWKEMRYAVYVTLPLAKHSTNLLVERVDLGEARPIDKAIQELSRLIDNRQIATKRLEPVLQTLGELVWRPMAQYLTNVSHLIICPDGQLSRLPFEALRDGHKYLLEDKTISYVSSGREIAGMVNAVRTGAANPPLVMGNPDFDLDLDKAPFLARKAGGLSDKAETVVSSNDSKGKGGTPPALLARTRSLSRSAGRLRFTPLPDSEQEARSVAQLVGTNAVLRLGPEAREAELKAVVSPRVLHLATHGFALPDEEWKPRDPLQEAWLPGRSPYRKRDSDRENPLIRCGIALAGANHASEITNATTEDGLLTGLEASLLNLQGTELVILSACESGKGDIKTGEGVMSLRRAFTIAGAQTVLASHWRVSDVATRQLMTEFIRRWQSGEPRAKAWRDAQLSLLRSKDFSSPYFWAAFTLTGQWR